MKDKKLNAQSGFTLLEILISVVILVLITSIGISVFSNFLKRQALNGATDEVVSLIEDARARTLASKNNSQYGVHVEASQATLFKGTTYSVSDPDNETIFLDSRVTIGSIILSGGGADIVFDRLNGKTSQAGTLNISLLSDATKSQTITIQETGIVVSN